MKRNLSSSALLRIWINLMFFNIIGCLASTIAAILVSGLIVFALKKFDINIQTSQYLGESIGITAYLISNIFALKFTLNHRYKNITISINEK